MFAVHLDGEVLAKPKAIADCVLLLSIIPDEPSWIFADNDTRIDTTALERAMSCWIASLPSEQNEDVEIQPSIEEAAFASLDWQGHDLDMIDATDHDFDTIAEPLDPTEEAHFEDDVGPDDYELG